MLTDNSAKNQYITQRQNRPTTLSSAEISREMDAKLRATSFFSARVAEAHILDRLRTVSDRYSRGDIGLGEARNELKTFLSGQGYDPTQPGLKNLASTARINLILDQNEKMATAVGRYQVMTDPDVMDVYPYALYKASVGSKNPRAAHKAYDGRVLSKTDPWLLAHWPPSDYGCNCELENLTRKQAEAMGITPPTPADKVNGTAPSGYSFDPRRAFESFDISSIKDPDLRLNLIDDADMRFETKSTADNQIEYSAPVKRQSYSDHNLESALDWHKYALPDKPKSVNETESRAKLDAGFDVSDVNGAKVIFEGAEIFKHWANKDASQIPSRLRILNRAIDALQHPLEIWDQGDQKAYIMCYLDRANKKEELAPFVVFVKVIDGKVISYFRKNLDAIDDARWGSKVQRFIEEKK